MPFRIPQVCKFCKQERVPAISSGGYVCRSCYGRFVRQKESCFSCGETRAVHKRIQDNKPICSTCYRKMTNFSSRGPRRLCCRCGEIREAGKCLGANKWLCRKCHNKDYSFCQKENRHCKQCGFSSKEYRKYFIHSTDICRECYQKQCCLKCKRNIKIVSRGLCSKCTTQMVRGYCEICKKNKHVKKSKLTGIIRCQVCSDRERYQTDDYYRTVKNIRHRVREAFNAYTKNGKVRSCRDLGIDILAIVQHIGPRPDNTNQWHVDHIIPLKIFDLTKPEHIKQAFDPKNHQWLLETDNLQKSSKVSR